MSIMNPESAKTIQFSEAIIHKLKTSTEIKAFVTAKFEKRHTIILGSEGGQEPDQSLYPVIEIGEMEGVGLGDKGNPLYSCAVTAGIVSQEKTEEDEEDYLFIEFGGISTVEKFRELIQNEILSITGIGARVSLSGRTLLENYFPIFKSSIEVFFEVPKSSDRGRV